MQTRDNNYKIFTLAFYLTKVNLSICPGNEPIIRQFETINPTYVTQKGVHYLCYACLHYQTKMVDMANRVSLNYIIINIIVNSSRSRGSSFSNWFFISSIINSGSVGKNVDFATREMQLWRFFFFFRSIYLRFIFFFNLINNYDTLENFKKKINFFSISRPMVFIIRIYLSSSWTILKYLISGEKRSLWKRLRCCRGEGCRVPTSLVPCQISFFLSPPPPLFDPLPPLRQIIHLLETSFLSVDPKDHDRSGWFGHRSIDSWNFLVSRQLTGLIDRAVQYSFGSVAIERGQVLLPLCHVRCHENLISGNKREIVV